MSAFDTLLASAGSWRGTSTLEDPHGGTDESASTATVTPVLGDRFVRIDYTWAYRGAPQEGSLLVGYDPKAAAASVYWIDSWHNGRKGMLCSGAVDGAATLSVRGSYAAPPGPDWGWRIELAAIDAATLRVVMYNVWPDSEREELAVTAAYARA